LNSQSEEMRNLVTSFALSNGFSRKTKEIESKQRPERAALIGSNVASKAMLNYQVSHGKKAKGDNGDRAMEPMLSRKMGRMVMFDEKEKTALGEF